MDPSGRGRRTAGPRVRMDPDTRREQLLDLGVGLLATRPLEELSIDVLAEAAGISRGLLYHYFGTKQEFHRAVVRRAADDLIAVTAPDESLEPVERLAASLEAYVDYVLTNHAAYSSLVRGAAGGDPGLRVIHADTRRSLTSRVAGSLDDLGLPDTPMVRLLIDGWSALVEEAVLDWVPQQQVPKERLVAVLAAALPAVLATGA